MLFEFSRILKFSLIITKAQGIQISLTKVRSTAEQPAHQSSLIKDRLPTYSIALIKKIIINLIHRPLLVIIIIVILDAFEIE